MAEVSFLTASVNKNMKLESNRGTGLSSRDAGPGYSKSPVISSLFLSRY
jgi:hypothetical protein